MAPFAGAVSGFDDIIVHLLSYGASAQVQVKGVTALMVAVEQVSAPHTNLQGFTETVLADKM